MSTAILSPQAALGQFQQNQSKTKKSSSLLLDASASASLANNNQSLSTSATATSFTCHASNVSSRANANNGATVGVIDGTLTSTKSTNTCTPKTCPLPIGSETISCDNAVAASCENGNGQDMKKSSRTKDIPKETMMQVETEVPELIHHDDDMDNDGGDWSLVSSVDTAVAASTDSAASTVVDVPALFDTLSDDGRSNHKDGNEHDDSDNMSMEMVDKCDAVTADDTIIDDSKTSTSNNLVACEDDEDEEEAQKGIIVSEPLTATLLTSNIVPASTTTTPASPSSQVTTALVLYNPTNSISLPNVTTSVNTTTITTTTPTNSPVTCDTDPPLENDDSTLVIVPKPSTAMATSKDTLSTTSASTTAATSYKGLVNLGNTCYLNSALQMLMSIDGFVDDLIQDYVNDCPSEDDKSRAVKDIDEEMVREDNCDDDKDDDDKNEIHQEKDDEKKYPLRDALAQFFLSMRHDHTAKTNNDGVQEHRNAVDPSNLKKVVDELTPLFVGFWQQDSHEFLSTLLDLLHDELKIELEKEEKKDEKEEKNTEKEGLMRDEDKTLDDAIRGKEKFGGKNTNSSIDDVDTVTGAAASISPMNKMTNKHPVTTDPIVVANSISEPEKEEKVDESQHQQEQQMAEQIMVPKPKEIRDDNFILVDKMDVDRPSKPPQLENMNVNDNEMQEFNDKNILSAAATTTTVGNKKPKISSTSSCPSLASSSSSSSSSFSAINSSLCKVQSFSQLNVEDIGELLHGEDTMANPSTTSNSSTSSVRSWASVVASGAERTHSSNCNTYAPSLGGKLVGGRAATIPPPPISLCIHEDDTNDAVPVELGASTAVVQESMDTEEDSSPSQSNQIMSNSNDLIDEDIAGVEDDSRCSNGDDNANDEASGNKNCTPLTPVDAYFTTEVRIRLTCDSCKYTRSHQEIFRHLSIEVGSADDEGANNNSSHDRTVQEGLRKFFAPEKRELKCEKCFCESATQTMEITRLPRSLLLHLKRFIVDISPDYSSITYRKNKSAVEFGETLSLSPDDMDYENCVLGEFLAVDVRFPSLTQDGLNDESMCDDEEEDENDDNDEEEEDFSLMARRYKLRSVVNHIGSSASCGHYTADAYRLYDDEIPSTETIGVTKVSGRRKRDWTRFNDSFVSRISTDDAMGDSSRKTAYMILYEIE